MYRVEDKYQCSEQEMFLLQSRLKAVLRSDGNQVDDKGYKVTSVYFDTDENVLLADTMDGERQRAKYRLRIYNDSFDFIRLEIKHKLDNKVSKKSCLISYAQMEKLLRGNCIELDSYRSDDPVSLFNIAIRTHNLRPRVIVEYDRKAFVYPFGNVRITLDRNVRSSTDMKNFLNGNTGRYRMLSENDKVLEIKYDDFLPGFIARMIENGNLNQISFSKYRLCRMSEEKKYVD